MNTQAQLRKQAIQSAKDQDWQTAVTVNMSLLEINVQDTQALNRLGIAYVQLGEKNKAIESFKQSLSFDKTNIIAQKNLERLKSNQMATPAFITQQFIEEPGKTRTVELCRLANKSILKTLATGMSGDLKAKKRVVSVEIKGVYVGVLPDDISFRLTKLIQTGNIYSCYVYSTNETKCVVYIKEESRSEQNQDVLSFISNKAINHNSEIIGDGVLIDDHIPVEILDHDSDVEKSYEEIDDDYEEEQADDEPEDSDK